MVLQAVQLSLSLYLSSSASSLEEIALVVTQMLLMSKRVIAMAKLVDLFVVNAVALTLAVEIAGVISP